MKTNPDGYIDLTIIYQDVGDKILISPLSIESHTTGKDAGQFRPYYMRYIMQDLDWYFGGNHPAQQIIQGRIQFDWDYEGDMTHFEYWHTEPTVINNCGYNYIYYKKTGRVVENHDHKTRTRITSKDVFGI